jgi:hypothetical protein
MWCDELGLSVNPDKTGLVAFREEGNSQGSLNHVFFGTTLHCSTSVKYLGVTGMILDSRLTCREHVDVTVRKAQNLLWASRRAYGVKLAWDPGWFIGSTFLPLGHPSLSHPWYGGLVVRRPVPRKN